MIVLGLCRALYPHYHSHRAIPLVCDRLSKMVRDFQALFDLWGIGRLPAARKRPDQPSQPKPASTQPKPSRQPGFATLGFARLVKILPEATRYREQLQALLAKPSMVAFLAEVPQAGEILRPLCRLLGVPPPETAPPEAAPIDIAPQQRPTAPITRDSITPDQPQPADTDTCTPQPEFLP